MVQNRGKMKKVLVEWAFIAGLVGILVYFGRYQFHLKHYNAFLMVVVSLIFFILVAFYLIRK